jgi:hypothetical protein
MFFGLVVVQHVTFTAIYITGTYLTLMYSIILRQTLQTSVEMNAEEWVQLMIMSNGRLCISSPDPERQTI